MEPQLTFTAGNCGGGGASGDDDGGPRHRESTDGPAAATAWLWGVYREMRCTSRDGLFAYFRGPERGRDLTPEILNLVGRMAKCGFPDYDAASFVPDPRGAGDRLDCALAASYLYYRVCEWELARRFPIRPDSAEAARQQRFKGLARVSPDPASLEMLCQGDFHAALLHCALEITAFAAHPAEPSLHYPAMTRRLGREAMGVSLWAAIRSFRGCFAAAAGGAVPLPSAVEAMLGRIEGAVLGSTGLATGSAFHTIAVHGGGYCYADGDPTLACDFFSAYASHIVAAGARAAAALAPPAPAAAAAGAAAGGPAVTDAAAVQGVGPDFPQQVARLLDELLLREAGLFYGQPPAVMVGCAAYVVAKLRGRDVRFAEVEQAILLTLPGTEPGIFDRAEVGVVLTTAAAGAATPDAAAAAADTAGLQLAQPPVAQQGPRPVYGHMRQFYNKRFLPAAEEVARAVTAGAAVGLPPVVAPPNHPLLLRRQQLQAAAASAATAAAGAAASRKQPRGADDDGASGAATAPPHLRLAASTLPPPSAGTRAAKRAEAAAAAAVSDAPGQHAPPAVAPMVAMVPLPVPFTVAEDEEVAPALATGNGSGSVRGRLSHTPADGSAAPPRRGALANAQAAPFVGAGAVHAARAKGGGGAAAGGLIGAGIEWRRRGLAASGPGGAAAAAVEKENAPVAAAQALAAAAAAAAAGPGSEGKAPQFRIQDPSPGTVQRVLGFLGAQRRGRGGGGSAGKDLGMAGLNSPAAAAGARPAIHVDASRLR